MNQYQMKEIEMAQKYPSGMADYMAAYGGHFSKKMCQWAVSRMMKDVKKPDGTTKKEKITPWTKEQVEEMLLRYGVTLENDKGYDKVYVANMCKADFLNDSVPDETHVAKYVKNLLDDPDGYEELVFNRFMMDCMGMGVPIIWEDMM